MSNIALATKRLFKDYENLKISPLPGASAAPLANNFFLWHANIDVALNIDGETQSAPMHIIIVPQEDYPKSAPKVGFCTPFPFKMGAIVKMDTEGPLKNCQEICLNILGNLGKVHDEWKHQIGDGWSSATSIMTLLVNLQSVFFDLDKDLTRQEKQQLINDLKKFQIEVEEGKVHSYEHPYPPLQSEKQIHEKQIQSQKQQQDIKQIQENQQQCIDGDKIKKKVKLNPEIKSQCENFVQLANLSPELKEHFYKLVHDVSKQQQCEEEQEVNVNNLKQTMPVPMEDDSKWTKNLFCYVSGQTCEETILGYGIYLRDKNILSTPAELIAYTAFKEDPSCRQSANKTPFTHFFPAFLSTKHVKQHQDWQELVKKSLVQIGDLLQISSKTSLAEMLLLIVPKLMSSMVVEMKKDGGKKESIIYFEALCSFWRTLQYFYETQEKIKQFVVDKVKDFIKNEGSRHKDVTPDLGIMLAMFTSVSNEFDTQAFIDSYLDENQLRNVMWWNEGRDSQRPQNVFEKTKVSRELLIFQITLMSTVLAGPSQQIIQEMDSTWGQVPERLLLFQNRLKGFNINDWKTYFDATGCSQNLKRNIIGKEQEWISECIKRSEGKGPKYARRNNNNNYNSNNYNGNNQNYNYNQRNNHKYNNF